MSSRVAAAAGLVAIAILGGCGSSGSSGDTASSAPKEEAPSARPLRLRVESSPHRLPAPVSGEAVAAQGKSLLVIGGLDRSDVSIDSIVRLDGESGSTGSAGTLSQPLHDAAATALPGGVLVFGGGSTTTIADVERVVPGAAGEVVGELPVARSDLSAVTVGGRAYVLGGYDGQETVGAILRTSDGAKLETVAQLPVPVRYAGGGHPRPADLRVRRRGIQRRRLGGDPDAGHRHGPRLGRSAGFPARSPTPRRSSSEGGSTSSAAGSTARRRTRSCASTPPAAPPRRPAGCRPRFRTPPRGSPAASAT